MAQITLKGNPFHTNGELPAVGVAAPKFTLVAADMSEKTLADFKGKKKILTINPSFDTPVCAQGARTFNERAAGLDGVVVLAISADLPFAQKRFCVFELLWDGCAADFDFGYVGFFLGEACLFGLCCCDDADGGCLG